MDLYLQQILLFLPLLIFFLILHKIRPANYRTVSHGLKPYPLLGVLPHFIKNRHRLLDWLVDVLQQSPTISFTGLAQVGGVITASPANVEHMLKTNFDNYPKGQRSIEMLADFLGHGIFNSDGEHWKSQRKAASFEFSSKSLRNFVVDAVHDEIVRRFLPLLRKAGEKSEPIDLQDVLERFAFDNICKVAFNDDPACLAEEAMAGGTESSQFMKAFEEAQNLIMDRFMSPLKFAWKIKKLLNVGSEKRLKELIPLIHKYATKIISARKEKNSVQYHDILSRFAANKDNSDEFLRDNITSFLLAGRETTSSALTWFFWILSTRPDVAEKITEEVRRIRDLQINNSSMTTFTYDELREMHYLHAALTESMRLYPPVPMDTQSCLKDDTMPDGTFVGAGWFVSYCAYAMGRMESIWGEDCKEFKPERWLEIDGAFRPESPFRYPVFHAGPRMCLGKEMAYIQMKSIIACVLEGFEIDVVGRKKTPPDYILSLTLRMKGGLPVNVREKIPI